jgi:RNA binding exosome subunit
MATTLFFVFHLFFFRSALSDAKVELEDIKQHYGNDIIVILKDDAGTIRVSSFFFFFLI